MRYNVYHNYKDTRHIYVYVKRKVGYYYKHYWIEVKYLNGKYYDKTYTKVSFNIFEAKQFINKWKALDANNRISGITGYWAEKVKDR